ncbi:hypothetical protein JG687_00009502 [Phytophthora cactorum]|uniref:Uncharacterized protein n=1 Tax=Phytophthora cactorum TaxID=29920 RepID=A0A8T1U9Q6_9STRA|nr:hypothetical protein JG687_00009502 [Phytophthora cactorum]
MLVASRWVFPIPFMVLSIISLYVLLFVALFRIIAGKQVFSQMATHRTELILLVSFSGSQSVMAVTYAAYEVLFDHVTNTHYELPVILLLPVIKLIMKNLVSLPMAHMKDMVPEGVIFTVDFFNSMYLATCMQNTSSITTTLEVLFFSECLLLTEYLESIIPVLYGLFILLVVNLPSAPYHVDLIGINRDNVGDTLANVYIYAFLEFVSFVTLTLLMMRNCRLQALCHLAFVLETQMLLVQVKLMTWVLMSLSFRVVHFGADFTFQFSWMDQNNA